MPPSATIEIPFLWQALDPRQLSGTTLVVGASDTGKSTFVRWLLEQISPHHAKVGWLDGDPGQSVLGAPSTMSLAVLGEPPVLLPAPAATFFVGSTSPKGHMLPVLAGLQRLKEAALSEGATALVVDTTGLVSQEAGGGALKQWKVEMLRPRTVIALQREQELEHLLEPWRREGRFRLHVLPVAPAVRPRSQQERTERRRLLFRHCFDRAGVTVFRRNSLPIYGLEAASPGSLLALLDREGFVLALGILKAFSTLGLEVLTGYAESSRVCALRFGSLRIDPVSGGELN